MGSVVHEQSNKNHEDVNITDNDVCE